MLKKIFRILIMILLLVELSGNVYAKDTLTATSTINGVTVNWKYEVNESNQIKNLKCTNPTALTGNITIPSTLEGKTVVSLGNEAFKSATGITEITIPSSVKEIENSAFENCTKLNKVDLGNITALSFRVFKGCTSLTEIAIPKTLKNGSVSPCLDNPNITKITLEEGLTVVPSNLCANTGITEITIPKSVKEIEYSAFDDCTKLNKVTILDNVEKMGFYITNDKEDSIFKNHNDDLTIYCYKDSMAANYALKYNIKYVYLTKPSNPSTEEPKKDNTEKPNTDNKKDTNVKDTTVATGRLPQAGITMASLFIILIISIASIIFYMKYRKFRDIK